MHDPEGKWGSTSLSYALLPLVLVLGFIAFIIAVLIIGERIVACWRWASWWADGPKE